MKMSEMVNSIMEGTDTDSRRLLIKYQNALAQFGTAVTNAEMTKIGDYVRELGSPNDATIFLHQIELMRETVRKNLIICKRISTVSTEKTADMTPVKSA
jgi:hypothetical protein